MFQSFDLAAPIGSSTDSLFSAIGDVRQEAFDAVVDAAAGLLNADVALILLVDGRNQWVKAHVGFSVADGQGNYSRLLDILSSSDTLLVADTKREARFGNKPLLIGGKLLQSFFAVPLTTILPGASSPVLAGMLAVGCIKPRDFDPRQQGLLKGLATTLSTLIQTQINASLARSEAALLAYERERQDVLHRQFRQAEQMAAMGSWRLTIADKNVEWSDGVWKIHELPKGATVPLADAIRFYPPQSRSLLLQQMRRAIAHGEGYDHEIEFITAKGNRRWVRAMCEAESDEHGRTIALVGVIQDITTRHLLQSALEEQVNTDALTKLSNRMHFDKVVDEQIAAATGGQVGIAVIDVDHFKKINDSRGHAAGDDVLCAIADALSAAWLKNTFAARFGGDEFVLIFTDQALLNAMDETIARLLHDLTLVTPAGDRVTATLGACVGKADDAEGADLLRAADKALYRAKDRRRGTGAIAGSKRMIEAAAR